MTSLNKWDKRWLGMAEYVSTFSKDPSTQVGAVMARGKEFLGFGYNGFPENMEDKEEHYKNREEKYTRVIHAEANLLKNVWGKDIKDATIYVYPFQPCSKCALQIINHGIKRVISVNTDIDRWKEDFKLTQKLFDECGVDLILV